MMAEYIEREAAIKMLLSPITMSMCLSVEECRHKQDQMFIDVGLVKSVPAADVQPVRHGRWHSRFFYREYTKVYDCEMHVCSECGSEWSYDAETGLSDFNYCPNCGAKMDGGET